jgi:hypothetical protein
MTMYYEAGLPASLIPVTFIGWAAADPLIGTHYAVVRLKRTHGAYRAGETLHVSPRCVVVKAGVRDGFIRVREASLPARTDANTLNPRS